jgi:hypothetical protein
MTVAEARTIIGYDSAMAISSGVRTIAVDFPEFISIQASFGALVPVSHRQPSILLMQVPCIYQGSLASRT